MAQPFNLMAIFLFAHSSRGSHDLIRSRSLSFQTRQKVSRRRQRSIYGTAADHIDWPIRPMRWIDCATLCRSDRRWVCPYLEIEPDGHADGHGGEAVLCNGRVAGLTASIGYGPTVKKILAFACIKTECAETNTALEALIHGTPRAARAIDEPSYDPRNLNPREDAP